MSPLSLIITTIFLSLSLPSHQQPFPFTLPEYLPELNSGEQQAVYSVLTSINPTIPWSSLYPDDLCSSAPHGVVCEYFIDSDNNDSVHITELSFGYVSDYTPNPPCTADSDLNPLIFTSFKYLRKLFFYKCFTGKKVTVPGNIKVPVFNSSVEEIVFVDNPALVGPLTGIVGNFINLKRLVLTGNGIYGNIPATVGELVNIEEITLSRNKLSGGVLADFSKLSALKVLDLSQNYFDGNAPESFGNLTQLLKLDLSSNGFNGKIPESLQNLQKLEFLDVSYNRFGNFGVPVFISKMPRLKEMYFSGNNLGGQIPEIWDSLGGILGIGFSNMGLIGNIPASMGLHLKSLCYLGLDNNKLEGSVPLEFGSLESVSEINLENNKLSGRVPFTGSKLKVKLKLSGNSGLCVDDDNNGGSLNQLKKCNKWENSNAALFQGGASSSDSSTKVSQAMLMMVMIVWFGLF
ncbi:hypothetical protein ACFE04_031403 [Oxalis oulophora]